MMYIAGSGTPFQGYERKGDAAILYIRASLQGKPQMSTVVVVFVHNCEHGAKLPSTSVRLAA